MLPHCSGPLRFVYSGVLPLGCPCRCSGWGDERRGLSRQGKARQGKARQGKTGQGGTQHADSDVLPRGGHSSSVVVNRRTSADGRRGQGILPSQQDTAHSIAQHSTAGAQRWRRQRERSRSQRRGGGHARRAPPSPVRSFSLPLRLLGPAHMVHRALLLLLSAAGRTGWGKKHTADREGIRSLFCAARPVIV
jgi:hypothetical protein